MLKGLFVLLASAFALACSAPLKAQVCEGEACFSLFESAGSVMGSATSSDGLKHYGFTQLDIDIPLEDRPILIGEFNEGGFGCNGGLGVPDGTAGGPAGGPGGGYSTSMTCSFQNSNGSIWRVTITITWIYNVNTGKWEVANMEASAKEIKFGNQVQ